MCDCHPRSKDDDALWKKVKQLPPTKDEWAFLHDAIERYRAFRVQNFKTGVPRDPQTGATP